MKSRLVAVLALSLSGVLWSQSVPKMPVGMNVQGLNYYSPGFFNDVMTASSNWITYYEGSGWDTQKRDSLKLDTNGYPIEIPQTIEGQATKVRCMINNCYTGRFQITWEGDGDVTCSKAIQTVNGKKFIDLTGECNHVWLQITRSTKGNHVRNIRILPQALADGYDPTKPEHLFDSLFLKGLRPFHALRFMDWPSTNGSSQRLWSDRPTMTDYTQGTKGVCWEHAITLSNHLNADPWVCVPHAADDNYILQMARLFKTKLNPGRKVYLEYSNEIWNWQFSQAHYVGKNGRVAETPALNAADSVYNGLRAVGQKYCNDPESYCHPEKDAYMMMRTFKLWRSVFSGADTARLIRVAAVQHSWYDNTRRVLKFLFETGNGGCDAVSPAGYFSFEKANHDVWNAMPISQVTPAMILRAVDSLFDSTSGKWTRETGKIAAQYKVDYIVYEGGQHMQPYQQQDWGYNQAVWDAQIHPAMYDMYMKNFRCHAEAGVNCKLFAAFSYVGTRQSKYGSWGHLESYGQLLNMSTLKTAAPKYQALLDVNTAKGATALDLPRAAIGIRNAGVLEIRMAGKTALLGSSGDRPVTVAVIDGAGRIVESALVRGGSFAPRRSLPAGAYVVRASMDGQESCARFVVTRDRSGTGR